MKNTPTMRMIRFVSKQKLITTKLGEELKNLLISKPSRVDSKNEEAIL